MAFSHMLQCGDRNFIANHNLTMLILYIILKRLVGEMNYKQLFIVHVVVPGPPQANSSISPGMKFF